METNCVNYYPVEPKHMLFSWFIIQIYKRTPFSVWIIHFFSVKKQGLNLNHNALMWALFFQAPFSSLLFCLLTIRGYMTKFFLPPQTDFSNTRFLLFGSRIEYHKIQSQCLHWLNLCLKLTTEALHALFLQSTLETALREAKKWQDSFKDISKLAPEKRHWANRDFNSSEFSLSAVFCEINSHPSTAQPMITGGVPRSKVPFLYNWQR